MSHPSPWLIPHQFKPGQRTNGKPPGSVNKTNALKAALLAEFSAGDMADVKKRHLELIHDKNGRVAVAALELLYDRLFGKARESISLEVSGNVSTPFDPDNYSDAQLNAVITILEQPCKVSSVPELPAPALDTSPSQPLTSLEGLQYTPDLTQPPADDPPPTQPPECP